MESSFDVLEWESTSKEQDSLVHRLFGDLSTSSSCSGVVKRKASTKDESTEKIKKKRKDKRQKNKFKRDKELSVEQPETATSKTSDNHTAPGEFEEPDLVHTVCENLNGQERKKAKKKKREVQTKQEDFSNKKEKNKIESDGKFKSQLTEYIDNQSETVCDNEISPIKRTNQRANSDSVNQLKVDFDPTTSLSAELKESDNLLHQSTEEHSEQKSKKAKKKKRRQKRELEDNGSDPEYLNIRESTTETNPKQRRRKKTSESEHVSSPEEPNDNPELKVTNSNILSTSAFQGKSSLHEKMTKQLESSRFRWINEQLYTTTGEEAVAMFSKDPNLFDIYHRGFTNQVKLWPVNPVNKIIEWLEKRSTSLVVADFGCGEAIIAQSVANKVHSFDLVAKNKFVTACNMAKVPLSSASIDVAVFCLSLMGTNLMDFLREAHRVLKLGGILKVAEVASRINDTAEFTKALSRLGFKLQDEDTTNKMFVMFDFTKNKDSVKSVSSNKLEGLNLKPCIYKKR